LAGYDDYLRGATSINHQVALRANFKMYSRSAKGGEKGGPNHNPWLAKMISVLLLEIQQDELWANAHLWYPRSSANRKWESDGSKNASHDMGYLYEAFVTKYQISAINSCWEKWAYMFNVYKNQQSRQTGSRNLTGPKRYPQYGIPIWRLWPNIRFLPSTVTEKNVTKNILDGWKDGQR
jgi:hypothetical protein